MRVALAERSRPAAPGEVVEIPVEVNNTSDVVDGVDVRVHGLDPNWVSTVPERLALFPDTAGTVTVRLALPPHLAAGPRSVLIELVSTADPSTVQRVEVELDIAPAADAVLAVRPATVSGRRRARMEVSCTNQGNTPLWFALTAREGERAVRFAFDVPTLDILPGEEHITRLRMRARARWFGNERARVVTVGAIGPDLELSANATFTQRPLLPRGLMTALLLALIVLLWAAAVLFGLSRALGGDPVARLVPAGFSGTGTGEDAGGAGGGGDGGGASATEAKLAALEGAAQTASGVVLAGATEQGVPRVVVNAVREGGEPPVTASTATLEDGSFILEGLIPGDYRLEFTADGFETAFFPGVADAAAAELVEVGSDEAVADLEITLEGEPGGLTGRVVAGVGGYGPPAAALVEVRQIPSADESLAGGGAEAADDGTFVTAVPIAGDGGFAVTDLATPGTYQVVVEAAGFEPSTASVTLGGGVTTDLGAIALTAGPGAISGIVTDGTEPLGAVEVTAIAGKQVFATTTLTEGTVGAFDLADLPTPGRYILTFSREGYGTTAVAVELGPAEIRAGLTQILRAGQGAITGRVLDPEGEPVAEASVSVGGGPVLTAGDGAFVLGGLDAPGSYTVVVEAPGFAPASVAVALDATGSGAVDITLEALAGQVTGVVEGPDGPVPGATVRIGDGSAAREAVTGTDGAFTVRGLPPGRLALRVEADGFIPATREVDVVQGGEAVVDITLDPEGG
ncbi:hypothetical protein BH20ACT2_BH20ACT2_14530 [soil metagenome]